MGCFFQQGSASAPASTTDSKYRIIIQQCHDSVIKQVGLDCMDKVILQFMGKHSVPVPLECTVPAHTTLAQ